MIQSASTKYQTSDIVKQAFEWKVQDTASVYSKLSKQKLKGVDFPITSADYINHTRSNFISESKDNYRGLQTNYPESLQPVCKPSINEYVDMFHENLEPSATKDRAGSLPRPTIVKRLRTEESGEPNPIVIIDHRQPELIRSARPKTAAKKESKHGLAPAPEIMTRFLSDSAFTKKFQKPLFAAYGSSANKKNEETLKTLTALPKNSVPKRRSSLRPRAAPASQTLKHISPRAVGPDCLADIPKCVPLDSEPRHLELFTTKILTRKSATSQPSQPNAVLAARPTANVRGHSDLFSSQTHNARPLNIFCDEPITSSRIADKFRL